MAATINKISYWFDAGKAEGASHMLVVCDGFYGEDCCYPVYVAPAEDVREIQSQRKEKVMEVYKLSMDKTEQLDQHRAFNY